MSSFEIDRAYQAIAANRRMGHSAMSFNVKAARHSLTFTTRKPSLLGWLFGY